MTKRPEVSPENYQAVYEYYSTHEPNRRLNDTVYQVGEWLHNPDIIISDETRQEIEEQTSQGKGLLLVSNHPSKHDALVLAGAFNRTEMNVFDMVRPLAKDSMFRGILRPITEATGGLPVFREKSYDTAEHYQEWLMRQSQTVPDFAVGDPRFDQDVFRAELRGLLRRGNIRMVNTAVQLLREGQTVSIMPEGTNSSPSERERLDLDKIHAGVGVIAHRATNLHSFIVPVGISYRTDTPQQKLPPRRPVVAFNPPITSYARSPEAIRVDVFDAMQDALDRAVAEQRDRT